MVHQRFDGYGSHLPVLETIRRITNFQRILEFGGGEYSTQYFVNIPGAKVTTVETQDHDWYLKIKEINPDTLWMPDHNEVLEYAKTQALSKDLVFLDTHQDLRYKLAPIVRKYSMVTVIHDTESSLYKIHDIPMDFEDWYYADFVMHRPWTGVMIAHHEILDRVLDHVPGIRYKSMNDKIYLADI